MASPCKRIGDVCILKSGSSLPENIVKSSGEIPYIKVAELNLQENTPTVLTSDKFVNRVDISDTAIFPKDCVIFPKRGGAIGTNKKRITGVPICADLNIMGVIPKEEILPQYLFYYFENIDMSLLYNGSSVPQINNTNIAPLKIFIPEIEGQLHIANVLSKLDNIIFLRKQQLAKLDELVKVRFVEMFGDINVNDKNWPVQPLGELCEISRGGSPRPIEEFLGGTVPWIKIGDATKDDDIYLHSTKEFIIESGVKKSRLVKKGSLIFANCGVSLGFARIITFDGCIHDGWLSFENIDGQLDKVFLLKSINQMTEYFRMIAPAGTQPNLNTGIMKNHEQIIPPLNLQQRFSEFVYSCNNQKLTIQQSLDKLEVLKKSLMQEYFG